MGRGGGGGAFIRDGATNGGNTVIDEFLCFHVTFINNYFFPRVPSADKRL